MTAQELIERLMTEHWDMIACACRFCREARGLGFRPRDEYPATPKISIVGCLYNGVGYENEKMTDGRPMGGEGANK